MVDNIIYTIHTLYNVHTYLTFSVVFIYYIHKCIVYDLCTVMQKEIVEKIKLKIALKKINLRDVTNFKSLKR